MAIDSLLEALEKTRDGYAEECAWHRFLVDAYTGGGGFQGAIKQPDASFWGAAADAYAAYSSQRGRSTMPASYLDRYPREDGEKYAARVAISHYPNYVEPLTDLKISYIAKRPPMVANRPDEIREWRADMDGRGSRFERVVRICRLRAAVIGWTPLLIDMDARPEGVTTLAQARDAGMRPRAVPLLPANLVDYDADEAGSFKWARIRIDRVDRDGPFDEPVHVSVYTDWYRDRFDRYEVRRKDRAATQTHKDQPHDFGRVPISVLRHKQDPSDPVKGLPMHSAVAKESKALFNRVSELEEHVRSQVFAVLVVAGRMGGESGGEISLGTDNALPLDADSKNQHYYLAPPGSVAETLEKRVEVSIREMYRVARVEYGRQSSGQVASGTSRKYEFAQTNEALADYAAELARFELDVDSILAAPLNANVSSETIEAQQEFGVVDLDADIKNVMDTISMNVGATATKALKLQVIEQQLPNMAPDTLAEVEAELDEIDLAETQEEAFSREIGDAETAFPRALR